MHVLFAMPGLDTKMVTSSTMREFLLRCRIPQQTSSPIGNIWAVHTFNTTKKPSPRSSFTKASEFSPYPFFFLTFFLSYFFFLSQTFLISLFGHYPGIGCILGIKRKRRYFLCGFFGGEWFFAFYILSLGGLVYY
jgi:hypothetical protein